MDGIINNLDAFLGDYYGLSVPDINIIDIAEIVIITFFVYRLLIWAKNTRALTVMRGLGVIIALFFVAAVFRMHTVLWLGEKLLSVAFVALVIVFQPELRKGLEDLGRKNFFAILFSKGLGRGSSDLLSDKTIADITKACFEMGAVKTGALIVIENTVVLNEYVRTGIVLDAQLTRQLLINIFEKNTPLHDGAVIVRGDRVVAATCYLPLSDNSLLSKDLGTRHRAGVGVSEASDSLTIIVSEETGKVSVAQEGHLTADVDYEMLEKILKAFSKPVSDDSKKSKRRTKDEEQD